jgi:DNA-binding NtrC family response regulator
MPGTPRALIAGCEAHVASDLAGLLQKSGLASLTASSVMEAMKAIATEEVLLVLCAAELEDGSYRDLLRELKLANWKRPVVVVFRLGEWKEYLEAIRQGAFDCIAPPYRRSEIARIIESALQKRQVRETAVSAGAR